MSTLKLPYSHGVFPVDGGAGSEVGESRRFQPERESPLQTRCRCSGDRLSTQLVVAVGRSPEFRLGGFIFDVECLGCVESA